MSGCISTIRPSSGANLDVSGETGVTPDQQHTAGGSRIMWDTVETNRVHLSHDIPCAACGHGPHSYLPCSDTCSCAYGRDRVLNAV
jgi:hypothetical protein